ncbi:MAG: HIT family protein [Oleiphilaceae bacterium]|nr:HIT family protein [Oleiphilaceae bacterium]
MSRRPCPFCAINNGALRASVIYEDEHFMIIMDAYPLSSGHVLIIPRAHHDRISALSDEHQSKLFDLGRKVMSAMIRAGFGEDGCNILLNDGKAANQTVPHIHLHIIPRKKHDFLRSLPKLALHVTGLMGRQEKRATLDEQARQIAKYF